MYLEINPQNQIDIDKSWPTCAARIQFQVAQVENGNDEHYTNLNPPSKNGGPQATKLIYHILPCITRPLDI